MLQLTKLKGLSLLPLILKAFPSSICFNWVYIIADQLIISIVIICYSRFVGIFKVNFVEEVAIVVCLVPAVIGRVACFLEFVEKVVILGLIEVVPQLLHFTIGLLIYCDFDCQPFIKL